MATQMTTRELEMYGCMTLQPQPEPTNDGYCNEMAGCKGETYAERKIDLLAQLGHYVSEDIFDGMSEIEIDQKARSIIMS